MQAEYAKVVEIFLGACELDPDEHAAYLEDVCGSDMRLRAEVEGLLKHDLATALVDRPALAGRLDAVAEAAVEREAARPAMVGGYRIVDILGEGGMGTVYRAEQENPRRAVALKVIKRHIASKDTLRRFAYESDVLARLRHPGIAQIYEAGMHGDGDSSVPFFVMEYIPDAKPLDEFADAHHLDVRERLRLLARVCEAVHHGHLKGVIHRDLKPANILVENVAPVSGGSSGTGLSVQPKIIDFGVARSIDSDFAKTTQQTDAGQLIGTLQYMSPEQVTADPSDLDTRSDVYALGVIAYQLLTGRTPYDLSRSTLYEATRKIREEMPSRLSAINRELRGDLETLVHKALEKDRDRRYQSAEELRNDIENFLRGDRILARPPSLAYQLRVVARQNRGFVVGATLAVVALVVGSIVSTSLYFDAREQAAIAEDERNAAIEAKEEATKQRNAAIDAKEEATQQRNAAIDAKEEAQQQRNAAIDAKEEAQKQTRYAKAINHFLNKDLLGAVSQSGSPRPDITMMEALDASAEKVDSGAVKEPVTEASIRNSLGKTYRLLGNLKEAERHYLRAYDLIVDDLGPDDGQALVLLNNLGLIYQDLGRYDEALPRFEKALEGFRRVLGEDDPNTLKALTNLGLVNYQMGRYEETERIALESLELQRKKYGEANLHTLRALGTLSMLYRRTGRYDEALPLMEKILEVSLEVLGENHADTHSTMNGLGLLYDQLGRLDEAEKLFQRAVGLSRALVGERHFDTLNYQNSLGGTYTALGKHDEAEQLLRPTLNGLIEVAGEDHPLTLACMNTFAGALEAAGKYDEAGERYKKCLAIRIGRVGDDHPSLATSTHNLGFFYKKIGEYEQAEQYLTRALEISRKYEGPTVARTLIVESNLGDVFWLTGRHQEALEMQKHVEEHAAEAIPATSFLRGLWHQRFGQALAGVGRVEEGESALLEGQRMLVDAVGEDHERTIKGRARLVEFYESQSREADAAKWRDGEQ